MSRCFPFPPSRNGSCSEALIESIKLRKENEKVNKDHKKEKRRERKEKKKERKGTVSHSSDGKELKSFELNCIRAAKNIRSDEIEHLEKSDITVEHDQPISWLEPCCSDSTQSSNKRKRSISPSSTQATGIKLRFSLRKHSEPENSKLVDQCVSIRSVPTADSAAQDSQKQLQSVTNVERDHFTSNFDLHREKLQTSDHGVAAPTANLLDDLSQIVVPGYPSLFQSWVPPPLTCDGLLSEDQDDWLFGSQCQEERPVCKRAKPVSAPLRCLSPSLWPSAQYLPEVELYALPYAVPF